MPASGIDFYLQDARNNFDAVRPAPIPIDANIVTMRPSQNIHISTNCYYGFHDSKRLENSRQVETMNDCEMLEVTDTNRMPHSTAKKRSAESADFPQTKKLRQEVQRENIEPETSETMNVERNKEDLLELLYWNTHGDVSSMCSLVGTRSSPSHSASAFNLKLIYFYFQYFKSLL